MKLKTSKDTIFVKNHGLQVDADWERINRFYLAAGQTASIVAPKPLEKRSSAGEIAYPRLDCSRPIFNQGRQNPMTFQRFGAALFELHSATNEDSVSLDERVKALVRFGLSPTPARILASSFPNGLCHGDCWHGNVFCKSEGRFIVLDPIPAPLMIEWMPNSAPGCIDLAYFCTSLFLGHRLIAFPKLDTNLLNHFASLTVRGYFMYHKKAVPYTEFYALCARISELWIAQFQARLTFPVRLAKEYLSHLLVKDAFFAGA